MASKARIEIFPGTTTKQILHSRHPETGLPVWKEVHELTGQWYWRLVSGNNRKMSSAEGFTRKRDAYRAAEAAIRTMDEVGGRWFEDQDPDAIKEVDR